MPGCSTASARAAGCFIAWPVEPGGALARQLVAACERADPTLALDRQRLDDVKRQRAEPPAAYFRANAAQWDRIRSLYIDEREVEAALVELLAGADPRDLLDIGTGTGRMLEILAPRVERALGIDLSREMLAVARVNLERAGLDNCSIRQGDMYQLPLPDASFDAVVIHQVLHYADRPARRSPRRRGVLRPHGPLVIVDFAPHAPRIPARRARPSPPRLCRSPKSPTGAAPPASTRPRRAVCPAIR